LGYIVKIGRLAAAQAAEAGILKDRSKKMSDFAALVLH
jgi:hypothetical protein